MIVDRIERPKKLATMNKYVKLFFRRIIKDFQQKELLPLKLLFFVNASTILILYPYLTIHMRELGINVEETAIMSAVIPVISILMPPIAGIIADKIGNFKILLAIFSALGGVSALMLLIVPVGRVTVVYPSSVEFALSCTGNSPINLWLYQENPCTPLHSHTYETDIQIETCGFVCRAITNGRDSMAILGAKSYSVQMHNIKANTTISDEFTNVNVPVHNSFEMSPVITKRVLKNNKNYSTSIRKLAAHSYFFPAPGLYNFSCGIESNDSDSAGSYSCNFGSTKHSKNQFTVGIVPQSQSEDDIDENKQLFQLAYMKNKQQLLPTTCLDGFPTNKEYIVVQIPLRRRNETVAYKTVDLGSCDTRCLVSSPRTTVCSNKQYLKDVDITVTFWAYLAVRVFIGMVGGTAYAMYEGAVIAVLREHKADYGLQRVYATIGGMISSPISGFLIDYASKGKDYTDYRPIFFLYASLKIVFAILVLFVNLKFKTPANNVISDVFSVLKKIELLALFAAFFILGTVWGYIESFLFWLIQDLGGSKSLMGITITVGGIAGIPLLVLSGPIIKRIGHANVIFIGFLFYAIRLLGYSLIYNPWLCLIFEAMESITSSLTVTAVVTYGAKLSTITTDTSVQGILGGLYFGVGKGSGSLVGGYLMKYVGTRTTFQIFSAVAAVTGLIYFCFNHFYMKKWPSEGRDITKKDSLQPTPSIIGVNVNEKVSDVETYESTGKDILPYEDALTNYGYEDTENIETEYTVSNGNTKV
ncbi:uncharacterized protein LOC116165602 isoform X2 [Photinus pyralis]|uniref:uncharacterized protein LOC116165602 isoform X2 n=1 Tax=Photinus pyralis TaxID=7054 RepID=UPI00126777C8|nr:uncharacterized protein LOC116165602 isoform X2 [Photinus pyralis]